MNVSTAFVETGIGPRLLHALEGKVDLLSNGLRARIASLSSDRPSLDELEAISTELVNHVNLFAGERALAILRQLDDATASSLRLFPRDRTIPIDDESALVEVRKQAGGTAARLGFRAVHRTKIVTASSELARNIHMYVGRGEVEIHVRLSPRIGMVIHARDQGPGIGNLSDVLAGRARSKRGMGMGLRGVKAMADEFDIDTAPGRGTSVRAVFHLPSTRG
jgi:serine/threonine-protein kinase RsbT